MLSAMGEPGDTEEAEDNDDDDLGGAVDEFGGDAELELVGGKEWSGEADGPFAETEAVADEGKHGGDHADAGEGDGDGDGDGATDELEGGVVSNGPDDDLEVADEGGGGIDATGRDGEEQGKQEGGEDHAIPRGDADERGEGEVCGEECDDEEGEGGGLDDGPRGM